MSQIADVLKTAIEETKEIKVRRCWFEPLRRGGEMQGPAGGWMYEDEDGGQDVLGYDAVMAIKQIIISAKIAKIC